MNCPTCHKGMKEVTAWNLVQTPEGWQRRKQKQFRCLNPDCTKPGVVVA